MKTIIFNGNNLQMHLLFRLDLMKHLTTQGWKVHVICPLNGSRDYKLISSLEKHQISFTPIKLEAKGTNPIKDLFLLFQYIQFFLRIRPSLVFNYTIKPVIFGSIAAKLCGIKNISIITGGGYVFLNETPMAKLARFLYKISSSCSNKVLFLNKADHQQFVELALCQQEKSQIIPGEGIDINAFKPHSEEFSRKSFTFLFIGRILYDKGIKEYFETALYFKDKGLNATFLVLGEAGVENPTAVPTATWQGWLETKAFEYLGFRTGVQDIIAQADCVVLPSYREGIPKVLLEASAMEKPIIATAVPGCADVVEDGVTGILIEPKNTEALTKASQALMNMDEGSLKQMGKKGRERVLNRFSNDVVFKVYKSLLNEI